ncbi:MAG TPA: nitrilase-related carbon-nitrogen hydrolase, partial [Prolixibacteraceae bacterium]|nr:nitrilase-related carbon-nitrogen hydrolase [Prolixibacteraceae bacterium]
DGATVTWMKELSSLKKMAIGGSLFIFENGKYYNRFCWVEPDGKIITYDKRHLFSMGDEDQSFTRGDAQTLIEYNGWKIFPQICYDLRFPVWSRNIHDYDLLINVANWPAPRNEVWKTLLKARSIENQCYTVAVNRIGTDGMNINYSGNSVVIDPKGIKLFNAHHREIIETVSLDYQELQHFRRKFNVLKDQDHFTILG